MVSPDRSRIVLNLPTGPAVADLADLAPGCRTGSSTAASSSCHGGTRVLLRPVSTDTGMGIVTLPDGVGGS